MISRSACDDLESSNWRVADSRVGCISIGWDRVLECAPPVAAMQAEPAGDGAAARISATGLGSFYWLEPAEESGRQADAAQSPAAADFTFNKKVMLTTDYEQTQSCAGSVEALTVKYGVNVTYSYFFANIGTTTFVTHTSTTTSWAVGGRRSFTSIRAAKSGSSAKIRMRP